MVIGPGGKTVIESLVVEGLKHGWYGARRRYRSRDGRNSKPAEESSRSVDHEAILGESVRASRGSSRGPLGYDQKRVEEQFRRWVEGE